MCRVNSSNDEKKDYFRWRKIQASRNELSRSILHHACCKELPVVQKNILRMCCWKKNFKKDFQCVSTEECLC